MTNRCPAVAGEGGSPPGSGVRGEAAPGRSVDGSGLTVGSICRPGQLTGMGFPWPDASGVSCSSCCPSAFAGTLGAVARAAHALQVGQRVVVSRDDVVDLGRRPHPAQPAHRVTSQHQRAAPWPVRGKTCAAVAARPGTHAPPPALPEREVRERENPGAVASGSRGSRPCQGVVRWVHDTTVDHFTFAAGQAQPSNCLWRLSEGRACGRCSPRYPAHGRSGRC